MNLRSLIIIIATACALVASRMAFSDEQLFAVLLGGNEVSDVGQANVGDPEGFGSAALFIDESRLCFTLIVKGISTPTMAHVHAGPAGQNGSVVLPLTPPPGGNPGTSSGCITSGLDPTLLHSIRDEPEDFYVNIHTNEFPAGAIRGQLF